MDETHAPGSGAADAVCLKITRGGITGVLDDAPRRARRGLDIYLASTFDGPRGIAAAVHAAAALRITPPVRPGDLRLRRADRRAGARGGSIAVPSVPGLA